MFDAALHQPDDDPLADSPIRVSAPAELAGVVPYLHGFHPEHSRSSSWPCSGSGSL